MAAKVLDDAKLAAEAEALAAEVERALDHHGKTQHAKFGEIWAYEVDGYGNALMMDDANAPGLLSLAYLGCCGWTIRSTGGRGLCAERVESVFFPGQGGGGRGRTARGAEHGVADGDYVSGVDDDGRGEIRQCLRWLRDTTAGTGFIHESFDKDDAKKFTRPWFAWANTLFGELVVKLAAERPGVAGCAAGLSRGRSAQASDADEHAERRSGRWKKTYDRDSRYRNSGLGLRRAYGGHLHRPRRPEAAGSGGPRAGRTAFDHYAGGEFSRLAGGDSGAGADRKHEEAGGAVWRDLPDGAFEPRGAERASDQAAYFGRRDS